MLKIKIELENNKVVNVSMKGDLISNMGKVKEINDMLNGIKPLNQNNNIESEKKISELINEIEKLKANQKEEITKLINDKKELQNNIINLVNEKEQLILKMQELQEDNNNLKQVIANKDKFIANINKEFVKDEVINDVKNNDIDNNSDIANIKTPKDVKEYCKKHNIFYNDVLIELGVKRLSKNKINEAIKYLQSLNNSSESKIITDDELNKKLLDFEEIQKMINNKDVKYALEPFNKVFNNYKIIFKEKYPDKEVNKYNLLQYCKEELYNRYPNVTKFISEIKNYNLDSDNTPYLYNIIEDIYNTIVNIVNNNISKNNSSDLIILNQEIMDIDEESKAIELTDDIIVRFDNKNYILPSSKGYLFENMDDLKLFIKDKIDNEKYLELDSIQHKINVKFDLNDNMIEFIDNLTPQQQYDYYRYISGIPIEKYKLDEINQILKNINLERLIL